MTKFNKKIIIYSTFFLLIVLLLLIFVIYPLLRDIRMNSKKLSSLEADLILFRDDAIDLGSLKDTYETYLLHLGKIELLFVSSEMPVDLIEFWESTAGDSGISIDISPLSPRKDKDDPWESIIFQLNARGSFSAFSKFLQKIENGPYLIKIENLALKSTGENEISASLVVKAFVK